MGVFVCVHSAVTPVVSLKVVGVPAATGSNSRSGSSACTPASASVHTCAVHQAIELIGLDFETSYMRICEVCCCVVLMDFNSRWLASYIAAKPGRVSSLSNRLFRLSTYFIQTAAQKAAEHKYCRVW